MGVKRLRRIIGGLVVAQDKAAWDANRMISESLPYAAHAIMRCMELTASGLSGCLNILDLRTFISQWSIISVIGGGK